MHNQADAVIRLFQRTILSSLLFLAHGVQADQNPPDFDLAFYPGSGTGEGNGIAVDGSGNIYITGQYSGSANIGGGTLTGYGAQDYFLASFDSAGTPRWGIGAGTTGSDYGTSVKVAPNGDIVVAASMSAPLTLHGTSFTGAGGRDAFVARYTSSGALLWAKNIGGAANDEGDEVAVDADGNVILVGRIRGTVTIGPNTIGAASTNTQQQFIAKFDASGNALWAKALSTRTDAAGTGVAVDNGNQIYVTGQDIVSGITHVTVFKLNSMGQQIWSTNHVGTSSSSLGTGVGVDASGNVYICGTFAGTTMTFGTNILDASAALRGFVVKHDASGNVVWASRVGGRAYRLSVLGDGTVYSGGFFLTSSGSFDDATLTPIGNRNGFITKYHSDGEIEWVKQVGEMGSEILRSITADSSGVVHVTGEGTTGAFDLESFPQLGSVVVGRLQTNALVKFTLTRTVSPQFSGSIIPTPQSYANGRYFSNTVVQLRATPGFGKLFAGWSGDLSGNVNPINITMDGNKSVTALFTNVPPPLASPCSGSRITSAEDFDGDGSGDLFWQCKEQGKATLSYMSGTNQISSVTWTNVSTQFNFIGLADFNGDEENEGVWFKDDGTLWLWFMDETNVATEVALRPGISAGAGWQALGMVDFDSNGTKDVLFQHIDGHVSIWKFDGTNYMSALALRGGVSPGAGWRMIGTTDFNNDNHTDILFLNTTTGAFAVWLMNGTTFVAAVGLGGQIAPPTYRLGGIGDFNGDSKEDLVWQDTSNGGVAVWYMDGTNFISSATLLNPQPITYTLTTNISPSGAGTISLSPPAASYASNATVNATAAANANFKFSHWTGASTAHTNSIVLTMNSNKTLTAVFTNVPVVPNYTLTPIASPITGGIIVPNPPGLTYVSNTPVTLTAAANVGFQFSHWIGLNTALNPAIVSVRKNRTITAVFTNVPSYLLSTNINPSSAGFITLSPTAPSNIYPHGTVVSLTAQAHGTNQFSAWLGGASFSNQVSLAMTANKSVTALFNNPGKFIIYNNTSGQSAVVFMQNTQRLGSVFLNNGQALATRWRPMGSGDFDGNGSNDVLLWSTNGQVAVWMMQNNIRAGTTALKKIGTALRVGGVADFNSDGQADILWHNPATGKLAAWQGNGTTNPTTIAITNTVALGWRVAATANFGNSSSPDLVLQHNDGRVALWLMNGYSRIGKAIAPRGLTTAGAGFQVIGATDLDDDGHTDIIFQGADGTLKVWYFSGATFNSQVTLPNKVAPGWKLRVVR